MNICVVYDCEYPWDIRVEKIIRSLSENSYSISLIARNKTGKPLYEVIDKISVYRLPYLKSSFLTGIINTTLFFNPIWIYRIFSVIRKNKCGLIIVRDLPLAGTAILASKLFKIPVIVDFAEPYPLTIRQRRKFEIFKVQHLITRNIHFADLYEKFVIKHASYCFVVCDEARDRLLGLGAKCRSIELLRNTPDIDKFKPQPSTEKTNHNYFTVLYVGILIGGRGLEVAINAISLIALKHPNIKLVIIGSGKAEDELKDLVVRLQLENSVFFKGWIDNNLVPGHIESCDVGILPFSNTDHINHTVANKLFDFMAIGKPVICSNVKPMVRIIKETNSGYLFEADNPQSLSEVIVKSYSDPHRLQLGKNGNKHVNMNYNWKVDEQLLFKVIKNCRLSHEKANCKT